MNVFEVVGFSYEADTYCVQCTEEQRGVTPDDEYDTFDSEGNVIAPIFASHEFDTQPACGVCGEGINAQIIGGDE